MIPRISSIENLIATDPGGRNVFGLVIADQLRLAAQSLRLAKRVGIVSGFYVPGAGAGETDGPSGAKVVGRALQQIGVEVDFITDAPNKPIFDAIGLDVLKNTEDYIHEVRPTHLLSIERAGRSEDGKYRNSSGEDISSHTAPLDELFIRGSRLGLTTIGIGDGGNEIGMGKVFADALTTVRNGKSIATVVPTDFCIVAGVSNWGAYGLAGALSVITGTDLLPSAVQIAADIEAMVRHGAVDGMTRRSEPTVDGLDLSHSVRMLEEIRRQISPSPLEANRPLKVSVLGYGEAGKGAVSLLLRHGHHVRVSDSGPVTLEQRSVLDGVESGGHSIEFLADSELVVASPGVRADARIRNELHHRGIPVMSEIELAYQYCTRKLIAVTGTVGKRSTVEFMQSLFSACGRKLTIGGNRGRPLSAILAEDEDDSPIAVAVSSFQLESVVNFRPDVAVILNIDEAHLDRHRTLAEYVRIKSRIFMNQRPNDVLILPFDTPRTRSLARIRQGRTLFISGNQPLDRGSWLQDGRVHMNTDGVNEDLGIHQHEFQSTLLVSLLTARILGLPSETICKALASMNG